MDKLFAITSFVGSHRFLSNFYTSPVFYDGLWYQTVEHAYQAAKTLDKKQRIKIQLAETPQLAKRLGNRVALREDWEHIKVEVMRQLLHQKFKRHDVLCGKLKATGKCQIIEENWWGDEFWGVYKGRGKNWLGKLLMEVRKSL